MSFGYFYSARRKPSLHYLDLAFLRCNNLLSQLRDPRVCAMAQLDARHVYRALMMREHSQHEGDVGVSMADALCHGTVHFFHRGCVLLGRWQSGRRRGTMRVPAA